MIRKLIDPPEGWRHGFPKELPENIKNINDWLVENGYPKELLIKYGDQFRYRIIEKNTLSNQEFEEKYKNYIEPGFSGLEIDSQTARDIVDMYFNELIKIPGFQFSQIKMKFNTARVYTNLSTLIGPNVARAIEGKIEKNLTEYCK